MQSSLSERGRRLIERPPFAPYILEHFARSGDPDYIPLCIAENRTMWDVLQPRLQAAGPAPTEALGYDAMTGNLRFRQELASFMGRSVLGRSIGAEQIAVLAGAGTVLELLFHAIADPGDGVLVPTPSYAGFWADLETRDQLQVVPVHCSSAAGFRLRIEDLDRALAGATIPVKALLFTTPNNPLGWVYSRAELVEVLEWARGAGLHVVFDEVYALSVFGERPFVSAASLQPSLGDHVHVIWAFSKDFGASGLRCGILVSENSAVLRAVDGLAYWAACSGDTQHRLAELVADRPFVDEYLATMRTRLATLHQATTTALARAGIPVVPSEAGIFTLCDMREFLDEPSWSAEDRMWRRILDQARVNLTPGSACRIAEPGFFRLCWAALPQARVVEGIERIAKVVA